MAPQHGGIFVAMLRTEVQRQGVQGMVWVWDMYNLLDPYFLLPEAT